RKRGPRPVTVEEGQGSLRRGSSLPVSTSVDCSPPASVVRAPSACSIGQYPVMPSATFIAPASVSTGPHHPNRRDAPHTRVASPRVMRKYASSRPTFRGRFIPLHLAPSFSRRAPRLSAQIRSAAKTFSLLPLTHQI